MLLMICQSLVGPCAEVMPLLQAIEMMFVHIMVVDVTEL